MPRIKKKKTKNYVIKRKLKFEDYRYCLEATQLESEINQLEKNKLMWLVLQKVIKNL